MNPYLPNAPYAADAAMLGLPISTPMTGNPQEGNVLLASVRQHATASCFAAAVGCVLDVGHMLAFHLDPHDSLILSRTEPSYRRSPADREHGISGHCGRNPHSVLAVRLRAEDRHF